MKKCKVKSRYPPYPGSGWDYAIRHAASTQLVPPNRCICIYCRHQAKTEVAIVHESDCPVKMAEKEKS